MYDFDAATAGMQDGRDLTLTGCPTSRLTTGRRWLTCCRGPTTCRTASADGRKNHRMHSCPAGEPAGFIVMYDFDAATAGMQDGRDLTLTQSAELRWNVHTTLTPSFCNM
ncbi:hypothetical protein [Alicyclobacillus sacchari]|uniref:hypothetical protein n=1 Tax=Alicyclobacillus sacchari TaxID=392010 RepID=UPI0010671249|nr:hypothetical protein [Alicyclobacillus sacchari]